MAKGRIIVLNGTSSSGKTSIARVLQAQLSTEAEPFYLVSGDVLRGMHPTHSPFHPAAMPRFLEALPESFAVLAAHGNNLIVEDIFGEAQVLNYAEAFAPFDALFVGVRCPIPVLEEREKARGDRKPGTAKELDAYCHSHDQYDLEVDTAQLSPEQAASIIRDRFESGPRPEALRRLSGRSEKSIL